MRAEAEAVLQSKGETQLTGISRIVRGCRTLLQGQLNCFPLVREELRGKSGIEIGGPSAVFSRWYRPLPIYRSIGSLDNCVFSASTVWASHSDTYAYHPAKTPGKFVLCDGSDISSVANGSYDFVLSSHNLEHFANPIKALKEWERIVRPGGKLVLVLPHYTKTFDHRRTPTPVSHMVDDFNRDLQESDLEHVPEILALHDRSLDPGAGSYEHFHERCMKNAEMRCLHHHVFDENNSHELLEYLGMKVLAVETADPSHIFLFAEFAETCS